MLAGHCLRPNRTELMEQLDEHRHEYLVYLVEMPVRPFSLGRRPPGGDWV
jgi:hypothetical protein